MITVQGNYEGTFEPMIGTWFPGIKKHLFITTRGTISLGIDCKRVRVNEYRTDTLFLTMPSVKVIAHEFEFTKISDLSWWKTTVQEIPKLMDSCKTEIEYNIRKNGAAFALAEIATEEAFRNYDPRLKNIPLVFKWDEPVEDIDEKKDTPFKIKWNRL
ncbi:MAG: hypothetical protein LBB74_03595 [Chitinispirillales bacterium]|nr:hypothetical protein [Chitinispirillales bacterium]